jgi:phosphatidylinositol glycan class B
MTRKHLLFAAAALLVASWFSVGFHQGDEHYQIIEFAAYKVGLNTAEQLPWEFGERMRPATQPAITYAIYKVWSLLGEVNPYHFAFFLRLLSSGLFLWLAVQMHRRYAGRLPDQRLVTWLALGLLFNWCSVYSGIRFSGENWSGMAIAAGFLLYPLRLPASPVRAGLRKWLAPSRSTPRYDKRPSGALSDEPNETGQGPPIFTPARSGGSALACFGAGLLFGLAFLFRYQVAIMVVGFLAWLLFIGRERWSKVGLVMLGGLVMVGIGTLLDYWFYEEWVIAPWHYLRSNLIEGKAATFGSAPWWDYFRMVFERGVPPLSLLYIAAPLWFAWHYRRDPLTWMMVPFLFVHFYLSRKDARFLFPLLPFVPVMILAGAAALQKQFGEGLFDQKWPKFGVRLLWGINVLLLLSVLFRPMISEVTVNKFVYNNYPGPVTLLADNKHIYTYANLTLNFYQRPGKVTIHHTKTREEWPACETAVCLYSQFTRTPDPPTGAKLVYTTRPGWADGLGLKEVLDGMKWWSVYELG